MHLPHRLRKQTSSCLTYRIVHTKERKTSELEYCYIFIVCIMHHSVLKKVIFT